MKLGFISLNRYYFRRPNCLAVLSAAVAFASRASLTFLASKLLVPEKLKIESVGNNGKLQLFEGKEYRLKILQEWAKECRKNLRKKGRKMEDLKLLVSAILSWILLGLVIAWYYDKLKWSRTRKGVEEKTEESEGDNTRDEDVPLTMDAGTKRGRKLRREEE